MVLDDSLTEAIVKCAGDSIPLDDLGELRWAYFPRDKYVYVYSTSRYNPRVVGAVSQIEEMSVQGIASAMDRALSCYWFDIGYE